MILVRLIQVPNLNLQTYVSLLIGYVQSGKFLVKASNQKSSIHDKTRI